MVWTLVVSGMKKALEIGKFGTRSLNFGGKTPSVLVGQSVNWYYDKDAKIGKLSVEKNGLKTLKESMSIPTVIKEGIKEDQAVVFLTENAMFFAPYSKGQEYLERILRKEGVKF